MLLVPTSRDRGSYEEFRDHPPVGDPPFALGRGLEIVALDYALSELIFNACDPRGHFHFMARQFSCRYAFRVEHSPEEERHERWDPENIIYEAVALSRLARDNAYSTEYAARVVEYENGELSVRPFDGDLSRYAYSLGQDRDWLDAEGAANLAALLAVFWSDEHELPERVRDALWLTERLTHEHFVDIAVPGLVAALERLISTSKEQVTRQFKTRVPELAKELGVPGVSRTLCGQIYAARSQGAHGSAIDLLAAPRADANVQKVAKMQTVLHAAVRRAIEDPAFRAVLADDAAIRSRWPVAVPHRWLRWRRRIL
ncbi:MAG: hypothetical protein ACRDM7_13625 [Thermoleophilaceae bacterium]